MSVVVGHGDAGLADRRTGTMLTEALSGWSEWTPEERFAHLGRTIPVETEADAARVERAAAIAAVEWRTIPRYDAEHEDTIGIVHGHAVYVPEAGEARCDCGDHRYRGTFCKHMHAIELVGVYDILSDASRGAL